MMAKQPPRRPIKRGQTTTEVVAGPVVARTPDPGQHELFHRLRPLPAWIEPCLPTLVAKTPTGKQWAHEIKWDGYRISAYVEDGRVVIRTRNGHDWTTRFPMIVTALESLAIDNAVLDGEAVVLDEEGRSDFSALQAALGKGKARANRAMMYAFDLLFLNGQDLREQPLDERRKALDTILHQSIYVRLSQEFDGDGQLMFRNACEMGLEGVVSKRRDAPYRSGRRDEWRKTKCVSSDDFIVIGYERTGASLKCLRLGEIVDGEYKYVGRVGTGFSIKVAQDLLRRLGELKVDASPIKGMKKRGVIWTRPEMLVEVAYRARTAEGYLRHASYKGIRD